MRYQSVKYIDVRKNFTFGAVQVVRKEMAQYYECTLQT